jgi:hypothetical protein
VTREFKCCAGCCWCAGACPETCAFEILVEAPMGTPIGHVKQLFVKKTNNTNDKIAKI